ncbi:hypothetical protein [Paenibacillus sp. sgz302251]|uniref:hypothetical protein n=1 Tax=Paenibacillus sp. sgz302251 TaxID=3414493 RepID=UPI003C7ED0E6
MIMLIGSGLAVFSVIIGWSSRVSAMAGRIFDSLAAAALFVGFIIAAAAVAESVIHDTVFMTEVHRVLLNPFFLISGAYLGPYVVGKTAIPSKK